MQRITRELARAIMPSATFQRIQAIRSRRYQLHLLEKNGIREANQRYIELNGTVVQHGPFAGMIYPLDAALGRLSIPRMLGTYESELHPILNSLKDRDYDCAIDVGAAEGYYAVGLARLLELPVYAFEPEPMEKRLCMQMAALNGVTALVNLRDFFTAECFCQFTNRRVLMLSDCEGCEAELFTPKTVSKIPHWDVLVELHGQTVATLPKLPWRHPVQFIPQAPSNNEHRPADNAWMWCAER